MGFVGDEEEDFLDGVESELFLFRLDLCYIYAVIDYVSEYLIFVRVTLEGLINAFPAISKRFCLLRCRIYEVPL